MGGQLEITVTDDETGEPIRIPPMQIEMVWSSFRQTLIRLPPGAVNLAGIAPDAREVAGGVRLALTEAPRELVRMITTECRRRRARIRLPAALEQYRPIQRGVRQNVH